MQVPVQKIVILGTGGTIAGVSRAGESGPSYDAAQLGVDDLLRQLPGPVPGGISLVWEQVAQIDSKDMESTIWQRLLARCRDWLAQDDVAGVVVTHGTDTLEETAFFLDYVLAPRIPVVLACAMRPADAVDADGPQNLMDAIRLASLSGARGVMAVCAGEVHAASDVQKIHPTRLDAFTSGDAGVLARMDPHGHITRVRDWPLPRAPLSQSELQRLVAAQVWPRVEIFTSHAGADGAVLQVLLSDAARHVLGQSPLQGVVVAATGNGTVHHRLGLALAHAQSKGIRVVIASRCALGASAVTPTLGANAYQGLSPVKARIALMVDLLLER